MLNAPRELRALAHQTYRMVAVSMLAIACGCSAAESSMDTAELSGASDETELAADALSGSVSIGSTLVTTADVNFRKGPSTSYGIYRVLPKGTKVQVVASSPQNGFYKVSHQGTTGWLYGNYVQVSSSGGSGAFPAGSALVTTADVNFRTGPSTSYAVIRVLATGTGVTLVSTSPQNGFYNVTHQGTKGWVYGSYIKLGSGSSGGTDSGSVSSSRSAALGRASDGVGFSYWWGHARWRPEGPTSSTKGSCSGSCPSCTHSGSYGADCSGYVGKIWQVGSNNSDITVDNHPYSTVSFDSDTSQWKTISRSSLLAADAFVYNSNGAGHIMLYEKGDGWGSLYAYECKGCSYGCVRNLRTVSSTYHAIRHY